LLSRACHFVRLGQASGGEIQRFSKYDRANRNKTPFSQEKIFTLPNEISAVGFRSICVGWYLPDTIDFRKLSVVYDRKN
jgi:hypothetical protein